MNKRLFSLIGLASALPAALWLVGCGGGGSTTGTGGASRATVMLTDSLRDDYSSVWATVLKAELINADGSVVTLFDDPTGQVLDLRRLRDLSGARYSFLASASIPAGTYTGIKITVAPTMTLFPRGSITGQTLPLTDALARDSSGNVPLSLTFATPKTLGTGSDARLIVDFDLANFKVEAGKVVPALAEGNGAGLENPERHERCDLRGVIASLDGTAPTQTFTLRGRDNKTLTVATTADTALFNRDTTAAATLAVSQVVEVEGRFNTTTNVFVATRVIIKNNTSADASFRAELRGTVDSFDATQKTLVVVATDISGATPTQLRYTTTTDTNTIYRTDRGALSTADAFFAYLAANPGATVEVQGTLDSSNQLLARIVKVEDDTNDGGWEDGPHHGGNDRGGKDDHGNGGHGSDD